MKKEERYPMCKDQLAQINCTVEQCNYYKGAGKCVNISPAISLNTNKTYVCWSQNIEKPTLGLIPKQVRQEQRITEIEAAISRYKEANKLIPNEWLEERDELKTNKK